MVGELAGRARGRLDELAARFAERMVAAEPVYAERFDAAERLTACHENLDALLGALVTGGAALDPGPHQRTGRRNAEMEVPLESLLHLYRLAAQAVWHELIAACGEDPSRRDALLEAATDVWEVVDLQSAMVAEAYKASLERVSREHEARRAAAVSTLLAGGDGDRVAARRAAVALGMGEGALTAVAHATLPRGARAALETALRARGTRSAWQVRGDVTVGVIAGAGLPADVEAPTQVALEPGIDDVTDVPSALELAVLALRAAGPADRGRPVTLAEVLPQALVLRSPDVARRLVEVVLGDPDTWRIGHADLLATLRAWYANGGDAERTAAVLYCHRNTVFNRLRRLQELTGRDLGDPVDLVEVSLATQALELVVSAPR